MTKGTGCTERGDTIHVHCKLLRADKLSERVRKSREKKKWDPAGD